MRKRAVSLALCLCMVLSLLPLPVWATGKHPFIDVVATDWFNDSVEYVYEHDLMKGVSDTTFAPYRATQRGMIVTILHRLEGTPTSPSGNSFKDVPKGSNYENAIIWAAANGIVNGYDNATFGPYENVTRQQMAVILYRYAQMKSYRTSARANLGEYVDSAQIGDYARIAMAWANGEGLINGNGSKQLMPMGSATRAHTAAILTRFCQNVVPQQTPPVSPPIEEPPKTIPNPVEPISYTVTFDLNYDDAGVYQTLSVSKGEKATKPQNPTRAKYSFLGWYTTATATTGGQKFNFNSVINSDLTLYARWSRKSTSNGGNNYTGGENYPPVASYYTVTFDSYGGSQVEAQRIESGKSAAEPTNVVRESYTFDGWYTEKAGGVKYNFTNPVTKDVTLYAHWTLQPISDDNIEDTNGNGIPDILEQVMGYGTDQADSDGDGIPDFDEENVFGTDKTVSDTDTDGLSDKYELFTLGTNPLKSDTDDNGTIDAEEDADKDGLTNIQECQIGTNPHLTDTDEDGLSDYHEVSLYNTNPLSKDSDADGLNDKDELTYQMNPLNPMTLNDGILDGNRVFDISLDGELSDSSKISPSLAVSLYGRQINSLKMDKINSSDVFLNNQIPGSLGNAYELSVDGDFSEATLSFELSEDCFANGAEPAIFYWNKETQVLEELPNQVRTGNILSAQLSHFSGYTVLDKNLYSESVLEYEIKAPTDEEMQNKTFDIAIVLDESGSIDSSDFNRMKQLCLNLLDDLTEDDRVAVITFDDTVRTIIGLSSKSEASLALSNLVQHGQDTALYDAIDTANNELSGVTQSTKIVIALTDGRDNRSHKSSSEVANHALESGIIIYTVGVGNNVSRDVLTNIAQQTHGEYNNASNFAALDEVFERIIIDADLYKDSDEDGISDYHEKAIANGTLKTGNGASISSCLNLNYLNEDSDGDGLLDGEEIEIFDRTVNEKVVYYCWLHSNPCLSDTDSDGFDDFFEDYAGLNPLINDYPNESQSSGNMSASLQDGSSNLSNLVNDWFGFLSRHLPWNFFHNKVEEDIWRRYSYLNRGEGAEITLRVASDVSTDDLTRLNDSLKSITKKRAKAGRVFGYIDIFDGRTSAPVIWDVKPVSYEIEPNRQKGRNQLEAYKRVAPYSTLDTEFVIGGNYIAGSVSAPIVIPRSPETHGYEIRYWNSGEGLILYYFEKEKVPVIQEQEQEQEQENHQEQPQAVNVEGLKAVAWAFAWKVHYDIEQMIQWFQSMWQWTSEWFSARANEIISTARAIAHDGHTIMACAYLIIAMAALIALGVATGALVLA